MSAVAAPRLSAGLIASVVLHGGMIAAVLLVHPSPPPPMPPLYRVNLLAAPAGERAVGAVESTPPAIPPAPTPEPPKPVAPRATVPVVTAKPPAKTKPKPVVKAATPVPPTPTTKKDTTPQPVAGGGPTGGKGADVANVQTGGIEFPYPAYINNIATRIILRFAPAGARLSVKVRFVIKRDGTVDPESIAFVERSGNFGFDQRALGAVEAAGNAKDFGPLPPGFREDILPVTFSFEPSVIR